LISSNTTGYRGIYKSGNKYQAQIRIETKVTGLGRFDSAKEAALAYDSAIRKHNHPKWKLNFPNGLPKEDPDYQTIMNPKKRRLHSQNSTGYRGVYKSGKRFRARIVINNKTTNLGTHDTPDEAALAYDLAVVKYKQSRSQLNYPNGNTTRNREGVLYQDVRKSSNEMKIGKKKVVVTAAEQEIQNNLNKQYKAIMCQHKQEKDAALALLGL